MWRRYLGMTALLLASGCLLLAVDLHSLSTAIGAAPASRHVYGRAFEDSEPALTTLEDLTPTVTGTPPTATITSTPNCDPAWSVVSSPNVGTDHNYLTGVAVVSANDVWVVGYFHTGNSTRTLLEHWDGSSWSVIASPNPDASYNNLNAVTAVSANDVWAVGSYYNGNVTPTLIEHWNGSSWSVVSSPNIGTHSNVLNGVAVVSANDVWAVGTYNSNVDFTLVEHWNGSSWSLVPSPNIITGACYLHAVAAVSASDVWAVGYTFDINLRFYTLVEHWNGTSWSVVPSLDAGASGNYLNGVTAVSANDVWTVGYYYYPYSTLVEHWNGTTWYGVSSPNVGGRSGVAAVSANDVWAVGGSILHWNGTAWSVVPSPNVGGLGAVAAVSANDVWAVGSWSNGSGTSQTLVEHYTPPCTTPTPTPTPTPITFSDVKPSDYFYDGVRYLSSHGVISGYSDSTFKPYDQATRAQVAKIVVLALGWQAVCPSVAHFRDVPIGDVFFCFVETTYAHGIINGYDDNTFRPATNITRAQLCKVVVLAMGWPTDTSGGPHFTDVPTSSVFYRLIETAVHRGIISGYNSGTFQPNDNTTRGQICKIVYGAIRNP